MSDILEELRKTKARDYTPEMLWADHDYMDKYEAKFSSANPAADVNRVKYFAKKYGKAAGPDYALRFFRTMRFLIGPADDWSEDNEVLAELILNSFTPGTDGMPDSDLMTSEGIDPEKVRARLDDIPAP